MSGELVFGLNLLGPIFFAFTAVFVAYLISIAVPYLTAKPGLPGDPDQFEWHALIPCRDEEAVIGTTVERLRSTFPQIHVWVIDDDSDDDTAAIVHRIAQHDDHVHLVQRRRPNARTGKGPALNAAYTELTRIAPRENRDRIIVVVLDADGELAPNGLTQVARAFEDERVGAAQTAVWMRNRDDPNPRPGEGRLANALGRFLVRMQDLEFRTIIAAMQMLRIRTNSVGLGGNGQFARLSVLDEIAETYESPWHGALLEDYEFGVHVLLAGYENRYVHDTHVTQEALPFFRRFATQRTRWAQGNMQCLKYLPTILRSPNFNNSAVVEACYYLLLPFCQVIVSFLWPVGIYLILLRMGIIATSDGSVTVNVSWAMLVLVLMHIVPFAMWGPIYRRRCAPEAPWIKGAVWGLGVYVYICYYYLVVFRAFGRVLMRKSGWAKTRRNAEAAVGPVAKEA